MAEMMGVSRHAGALDRSGRAATAILAVEHARAPSQSRQGDSAIDYVTVHAGETVGVAGTSGHGQSVLIEMRTAQRRLTGGTIRIKEKPFGARPAKAHQRKVRASPEEPLKTGSAPQMSVLKRVGYRVLELSDRIGVMGGGRITLMTALGAINIAVSGAWIAGRP